MLVVATTKTHSTWSEFVSRCSLVAKKNYEDVTTFCKEPSSEQGVICESLLTIDNLVALTSFDVNLIIVHESPEIGLGEQLEEGESFEHVFSDWQSRTKAVLSLYRKNRVKIKLVSLKDIVGADDNVLSTCADVGLPLTAGLTKRPHSIYSLFVQHEIRQSTELSETFTTLVACTTKLNPEEQALSVQSVYDSYCEQRSRLDTSLQQLETEKNDASDKAETMISAYDGAKVKIDELRQKVDVLEAQNRDQEQGMASLKADQLAAQQDTIEKLRLAELELNQSGTREQQLTENLEQLKARESEIAETLQQLKARERESAEALEQSRAHELATAEALKQSKAKERATAEALEQSTAQERATAVALEQSQAQHSKTVEALEQSQEQQQQTADKLKQLNHENQHAIEATELLKNEKFDLTDKLDNLRYSLQAQRDKRQKLQLWFKRVKSADREMLAMLNGKVFDLKDRLEEEKLKAEKLSQDLEDTLSALEEQKRENSDVLHEKHKLIEKLGKADLECKSLTDQIEQLRCSLESAKHETAELESRLVQQRVEYDRLQKESTEMHESVFKRRCEHYETLLVQANKEYKAKLRQALRDEESKFKVKQDEFDLRLQKAQSEADNKLQSLKVEFQRRLDTLSKQQDAERHQMSVENASKLSEVAGEYEQKLQQTREGFETRLNQSNEQHEARNQQVIHEYETQAQQMQTTIHECQTAIENLNTEKQATIQEFQTAIESLNTEKQTTIQEFQTVIENLNTEKQKIHAESVVQAKRLERDITKLEKQLSQRNVENATMKFELIEVNRKFNSINNSISWKAGSPIRAMSRVFIKSDPKQAEFQANVELLQSSDLFDAAWYLQNNADVLDSGGKPEEHYLKYGAKEGRNPSYDFDGNWYLEQYPDAARAGLNPLVHYIRFGRAEGRSASPKLLENQSESEESSE